MNILEITGEPIGTGGQEMFIINVLRHINMKDLKIDLLTPYYCENEIYREEVVNKGGQVYCIGLPFAPGGFRWNIMKPLNRFLKVNRYDVVHIHSGSTSMLMLCSLVARWNGIKKIIVHSHCTGYVKSMKYYLLKMLTYPVLRFIPSDYCACSVEAGMWKFPMRIVKTKLQVVKNGIDLTKFHMNNEKRMEYRSLLNIADGTIVIGHVGRFSFVKNQEFLIEVLSLVKQQNIDVKLMLIGTGETLHEIRDLVKAKDLENEVLFVGAIPNVYDYMQAMDVFAFPSRWEGLGIVGIEAQAVGLPVIASDVIPKEMKLVDSVSFLSLNCPEKWADCMVKTAFHIRRDSIEIIKNQGYDIINTAEVVRAIYTNPPNMIGKKDSQKSRIYDI